MKFASHSNIRNRQQFPRLLSARLITLKQRNISPLSLLEYIKFTSFTNDQMSLRQPHNKLRIIAESKCILVQDRGVFGGSGNVDGSLTFVRRMHLCSLGRRMGGRPGLRRWMLQNLLESACIGYQRDGITICP